MNEDSRLAREQERRDEAKRAEIDLGEHLDSGTEAALAALRFADQKLSKVSTGSRRPDDDTPAWLGWSRGEYDLASPEPFRRDGLGAAIHKGLARAKAAEALAELAYRRSVLADHNNAAEYGAALDEWGRVR